MDVYIAIGACLLGFLTGAGILYLVIRPRMVAAEHQLAATQEELVTVRMELAEEKARLEELRNQEEDQTRLLDGARERLRLEFENLANRLFDQKTEQSKANIETLLKPLQEKLIEFQNQVATAYEKEGRERFSLAKEVQRLIELNQQVSKEAEALTKALKGDNKTAGTWGEVVLERVLESSGLRNGVEYETQSVHQSEAGRILRPDVIVHLPENRDVVIDSKVSLVAYEAFCNAETEPDRDAAAKEFLNSVRTHMKGLAAKEYDQLPEVNSLDFVLMFIPVEGAFMLALQLDQDLYRKGFEQGIMLVSPSTLLFCLRTIQNLWKTTYQNRNAIEIANQASGLYDKFVAFVEDLEGIGKQLERAQKSYEAAHNKLKSGRGCLVNRAQTLIDLGVKAKKKLPASVTAEPEEPLALDQEEETA